MVIINVHELFSGECSTNRPNGTEETVVVQFYTEKL